MRVCLFRCMYAIEVKARVKGKGEVKGHPGIDHCFRFFLKRSSLFFGIGTQKTLFSREWIVTPA